MSLDIHLLQKTRAEAIPIKAKKEAEFASSNAGLGGAIKKQNMVSMTRYKVKMNRELAYDSVF